MQKQKALVLFSGGRDSSATAIEMVRQGYDVTLFTFNGGMLELRGDRGDSAPDIRHAELLNAFPNQINQERIVSNNAYLLRKLAIEKTNTTHVVYPIALILNVLCDAILYCKKNGIEHIACGFSGYQSQLDRYIEQHPDFFNRLKDFVSTQRIELHAPIILYSKEEVVDTLLCYTISSNSLETSSIFSGVPFDKNKAVVFWDESLPFCREYINYKESASEYTM